MKYLKRFNESLNENSVVDDLIDYLSSNVLIYDLNNLKSTIYSSDTLKEISVISGDTECISFSFENKEVKIYVPKYEYNSYLTINHNNIPTFNNLKLPINSNFLYLKINNMLIDLDYSKQKMIYFRIAQKEINIFKVFRKLREDGIHKSKMTIREIYQRMEEFEIGKGNRIDLISLNSLYDYYQMTFNEREIKEYLSKSDILYQ